MENELRFVHREETFNDLAVRELAESRSACICRLQFGRCSKEECSNCEIGKQYRNCYNQMNDYDKQRLSKYVSEKYVKDSVSPAKWLSYKGLCNYTKKWFLITAVCLFVIFLPLLVMAPGDKPDSSVPCKAAVSNEEVNNHIIITIKLAQKYIRDMNRDGKTNCIDYATAYKKIWDAIYPEQKEDCIIIRNKSLMMHHLFIGIYSGNEIIFVEPWAANPSRYLMTDNWSSKWDPRNNKYDETEKWLAEGR